ncbi:DUF2339 domain-containing protein [Pseudonocardia sp. CA-107938]|uniref:DUF2339 domain-containing protein n=1 Tax=Pseudonocardia sp. CA-107938 TaxID=3240021 RepID=UPI003D8A52F8
MSTPHRDEDPLGALAGELAAIGHRLDRMAAELAQLRQHKAPAVPPPVPADPARTAGPPPAGLTTYPPPPGPGFGPAGFGPGQPFGPPPPATPPPFRPPAPPPARPSLADRAAAIGGARLLAWTGAAITLLGVAMFLALAVSRGWFAPPVRIGAGAVLGMALVGLGLWLHRRAASSVGAVAVAATGFATLYLVIAGATAVYDYLAPAPAIALAFLVAVGGLGLADLWRSPWLANGVVLGALVLAPVLADGWLLVALALAMSVAALPVVWRREWSVLALLVGGLSALYGTFVGATLAQPPASAGNTTQAIAVAVAALLVGLVTAGAAGRRIAPGATATLAPIAALPALVTALVLTGRLGAVVAAGAGLALVAACALPWLRGAPRLATATSAAVALLAATGLAFDGATLTLVLLGQALVAAVVGHWMRSRFAVVLAAALAVPGVLRALVLDAPVADLVTRRCVLDAGSWLPPPDLVAASVASLLVIALAVMLLAGFARLGWVRSDAETAPLWAGIGIVGLYGVTGLVVNLALLVDNDNGFTAGHALVTVSWTVAALVLLARGISRPALRVAGMALVAAAVAKLVLFDLSALDGIARVGAFVGAGLVLLAAGTRYARLITEHQHTATEEAPHPVAPQS